MLEKHREQHEKVTNDLESDESDEIEFINHHKKPNLRDNKFVKYNAGYSVFIDNEFWILIL